MSDDESKKDGPDSGGSETTVDPKEERKRALREARIGGSISAPDHDSREIQEVEAIIPWVGAALGIALALLFLLLF